MQDQNQMTAEEQAEQEFAAAFADDTAGAPEDDSASFDENPEPSSQDEDGSDDAPKSAPDQEEPKEEPAKKEMSMEDKAHGYDSMFGRLEKERAEKARLEAELAQLRSQKATAPIDEPASDAPAKDDAPGTFEIPDELKDDLAVVEQEDPQLAALFAEDSTDGARLRGVLEDYGKDMALIQASAVKSTRDVKEQTRAVAETVTQTVNHSAEQAHTAAICAAVDGYEDLITNPARAEESQTFHQDLRGWVAGQPYTVAAEKFEVIEKGTPAQVAALINEFKATRGEQTGTDTNADADAALAVPSKPSPLPKSKGDKNDFDAGWDED